MNKEIKKAADRIRSERESKKLTRERFEEISGISSKYLYEIESGKKNISIGILLKICIGLETTPDYILLGKNKNSCELAELSEQLNEKQKSALILISKLFLDN